MVVLRSRFEATRPNVPIEDSTSEISGGPDAGDTVSQPPAKRARKTSGNGPHLTKFLSVYKGLEDWHLPIFRSVQAYVKPNVVLYPGSSRHATASLVFEKVTYVDNDKKVQDFFQDARVKTWIECNKEYPHAVKMDCLKKNFDSQLLMKPNEADLLISACAGIVSQPCAKYLKDGGHLLVSDAHFDARETFLNPRFQLLAVVSNDGEIGTSKEDLQGHFITTKGTKLSRAQVEESKSKPKARRSFKLEKEGMFYLFRKPN